MRQLPAPEWFRRAAWLTGLMAVVLIGLGLSGVGRGAAQGPHVTPDSSAVVVLVDNRTSVPVEIFFKRDSATYDRLGVCPPASTSYATRCLYVIPSDRLGALASFQLAGLAHGEAEPTDSPPYRRIPGKPNVAMYTLSAGVAPAAQSSEALRRVY